MSFLKHSQLKQKVAEKIKETLEETEASYEDAASEVMKLILFELEDPSAKLLDEIKINEHFTHKALKTRWIDALHKSALKETN